MKAIVYHAFGTPEVLDIEEVTKPIPKDNEVLIEVYATSVNSGDSHMRSGEPFLARVFAGPVKPRNKILGTTVAGKVTAKGKDVTRFDIDDEVFGSLGVGSGAHAQFVVVPEEGILTKKPSEISFEEAASLPFGALSGKYFLNKAGIKEGMKILVIGASGSVGSSAIQLAKNYKANVIGVCSTESVDFVKSIGANDTIDYKKENIADHENEYDIILDTVGNTSIIDLKKMLKQEGVYVTTIMKFSVLFHMLLPSSKGKKIIFDVTKSAAVDMAYIRDLVVSKKYIPLIEHVYSMKDIRKAHEHVEKGSKNGTIVVKIK